VLNDGMKDVTFRKDETFGFDVPLSVPGVDPALLNPRDNWADPAAYDAMRATLTQKFRTAFEPFRQLVSPEVAAAGPA
jgi:phosphoenolpyruvate carboxykinase (ATP)